MKDSNKKEGFGYEVKDTPPTPTPEPDVVKAVQDEIKKLGDNSKSNFDELRRNYEQLKSLINAMGEKVDPLVKAQLVKLAEDITTRQNAIDQKLVEEKTTLNKRIDDEVNAIKVAMKRLPQEDPNQVLAESLKEEARIFVINAMTVRDKEGKGATYERVRQVVISVDEYIAYKKAFEAFLRTDERRASPEHLKSLSVGIDPDGGYTVTPVMSNRVITRLYETDPLRQLCAVETISTGAIEWMVDFGEAGFGWEGETKAGVETGIPVWNKKRIPVHIIYAKPRATQTLLEDSGINIENWLADKVASRFIRGEGAAFVSGDGVSQPRGFLTYPNYATAGVDQWGAVERQNIGAAAALTADGFIAVKYRLIEQFLTRGTWLMNRLTVADAMYLKDGMGQYIWKPGFDKDANSTILGLPVRMSTTMPVVAAGVLAVALADWAEAYMIVDRLGITVQRDPFTVKPYVEFYTRKRVGGDVINYQAIKLGNIAI